MNSGAKEGQFRHEMSDKYPHYQNTVSRILGLLLHVDSETIYLNQPNLQQEQVIIVSEIALAVEHQWMLHQRC